jgi:hypothetical protein
MLDTCIAKKNPVEVEKPGDAELQMMKYRLLGV